MTWHPLLDGELAARAEDALLGISECLGEPSNPCLDGKAGVALFHGYVARASLASDHHVEQAGRLIEHAVDELATTPMQPGLHTGFTGIAWAAEHLARILGEDDPDDISESIDDHLLTALAAPWAGDYDLINGLAGFGVYALERVPRPSAVRCLELIVDRLYETAETLDDGITWFTSPDLLYPHQRKRYPGGGYNLGVAHGVPGVIAFLASVCRIGIGAEKALPLLEGAVRWTLSRAITAERGARFPAWIAPGVDSHPSRLAWCYGDPGVAATLLCAARVAGNDEWKAAALDIALRAATTPPEAAGVDDAGLCHGAFGLAHLYNRFYQAGGGDTFAAAARLWYSRGLDMRRPGRGIAGFESWEFDTTLQLDWRTDPGFLAGASGIGLALLAALTTTEPEWDSLLMLSGI